MLWYHMRTIHQLRIVFCWYLSLQGIYPAYRSLPAWLLAAVCPLKNWPDLFCPIWWYWLFCWYRSRRQWLALCHVCGDLPRHRKHKWANVPFSWHGRPLWNSRQNPFGTKSWDWVLFLWAGRSRKSCLPYGGVSMLSFRIWKVVALFQRSALKSSHG